MALFKKSFTRYVDADGKRCRKDAPGAVKQQSKSAAWYGRYRDADGIEQTVKLATNKTAAQTMLSDLHREAERGRAGIVDPFAEHHKRTLSAHVEDFREHLASKGNTATYVDTTESRLKAIIEGCKFCKPSDLSASRVDGWLKDQREAERFGIATSNHYLRAVKAFSRWLVKDRRIADDRFAHLSRLNGDTDRRIERRHLSPEDFGRFIEATRGNGDRYGLSADDRAMHYLTAAYTGLRASELASLTAASFDLNAENPTVTVEAAYSKHRKRDELPLHPDLVTRLREWFTETRETTDDQPNVISINGPSEATHGPLWPGRWAMVDGAGGWSKPISKRLASPTGTNKAGSSTSMHCDISSSRCWRLRECIRRPHRNSRDIQPSRSRWTTPRTCERSTSQRP